MRTIKLLGILFIFCSTIVSAKSQEFRSWYYECIKPNECRIYAYSKIPKAVDDDPDMHAFVLALHSDSTITFDEVWDTKFQKEISSDKLPVVYTISNYHVVHNTVPMRFGKKTPIHIKVGDIVVESDRCGIYCTFSNKDKIKKLVNMFFTSSNAEVYVTYKDWKTGKPDDKKLATISLMGFAKAYKRLDPKLINGDSIKKDEKTTPELAISLIKANIKKNKLGAKGVDLLAKKNQKGDGYFIYVAKTNYYGYERLIVWYVIDNKAMKLNSPSSLVTPGLPWSREIYEDSVWDRAGFSKFDATREALSQVFGRNP